MDEEAEEHQGESHPKITGTADEKEVFNAKGTTGSDQAKQGETFKSQSERESPSKEITEPDQQFKPAQPLSKSSGMEPDLTAEDPDVLKRKEPQGETGYEPETAQKERGLDQELDRRQEPESDESQEQKSGKTREQELYRRQGQESDNGQEHESDQRQEQKLDERQNQQSYQGQEQESEQTQDVESEQQKEEDSEPRGYSDSDSTTQLLPQHDKRNIKDQNTDKDKDKKKYKIFVIGKTGTGKSSLCNKIIGRNAFATGRSFKQVTTETQEEPATLSGLNITVVDTPDISDRSEAIQKDTAKRWRESAKGYNYMVVLAVRCDARYSPAEYEVYRQIEQLWGHDLVKRVVVAFTFGDTREDQSLDMKEELVEVCPELKHDIKDANNRYVVFNNEPGNTDEKPVKELVKIMKRLEDGPLWKWVALSAGFVGFVSGYAIYKIVYYPLCVFESLMDILRTKKRN